MGGRRIVVASAKCSISSGSRIRDLLPTSSNICESRTSVLL